MSTFFTFFIATTFVSSIGVLLIFLLKKALKKHISVRWQYNLGLLFFVLLIVPLIPSSFFATLDMGRWLSISYLGEVTTTGTAIPTGEGAMGVYGTDWLQDFAIPVERFAPGYLPIIFMWIWIAGIIVSAIFLILNSRNLRLIKESVKPIEDEEILSLFFRCKYEVGIKSKVLLGSSILVKTPMTVGFFKPQVILPAGKISLTDVRYAMLHELIHCKNKDIKINSIMCLLIIIYWFNPVVYFAFKQMRLDRELACDASVLEILPSDLHIGYGETLINFVKSLSTPPVPLFAASMGDSKPQIIKRVRCIASYKTESGLLKIKSICLFFLMVLLIFCKIPVISALADSGGDRFHFQADNVIYTDLSHFFDGREGSFVLYDLETDLFTIHNRDMSVTRVSPNSTYKIFSALIALETGILDADDSLREWDGTMQIFESWNQNQDLASAMQNSTSWYFQDLDVQIGIEYVNYYLTQLSYGNQNLTGGIEDFWLESSLRISPVEQVEILTNFYRNNTIFDSQHVNTLMDVLQLYERDGAIVSGKTGTGLVNGDAINGWFVGYIETDGRTFVFATYMKGHDTWGSTAAQITLSILEDMGIL
ncbi:MAG: BlaR1 family beta-lactam sensor/signal transducer [Defluviitaleaceae bacterium]|nr:BlaR1 family beta-lactam sensor/signal transducer [Defluviitaleaceae bacterium]